MGPRYRTLRDYLAVIRTRRWILLACIVLFAGAGLALTLPQDPKYTAEAALQFRDIERELDLLGTPAGTSNTAQASATINAEFTESEQVAREAARELKLKIPARALLSSVSAQAEASTQFVVIEAETGSPTTSAAVANAFAEAARKIKTRQEKRRLRRAADALRREIARQTKGADQFSVAVFGERVARIEALADFARPVEIVRNADPPASPSSPKVARTTILAALIGLVIGLSLAFIRDALDARVRGTADLRRETDLPVLGTVKRGGPLRGIARGPDSRALEAFRIIRTNLEVMSPDRALKTVVVTSAVEGEGKTTVATALARATSASGRSALLIECDLRRPRLAKALDVPPGPGLAELLSGGVPPSSALHTIAPENGAGGGRLDFIAAGEATDAAPEKLGSPEFRDLLGVLSRSYDQVILDTTPILPVADTLQLVPLVDAIVLCARASHTTRQELRAAKEALDRFPPRPCGLVLTGAGSGDSESYQVSYAARE